MSGQKLTVANGITLFRLFLFAGFAAMLYVGRLPEAISLFIAAWLLDAVDGWIARKMGQASDFGSKLDKLIDRLIIALGVLFLIRTEHLPPEALLILTKDIALFPALTLHAMRNEPVKDLGVIGKGMTFLQGAIIAWLLFGGPYPRAAVAFAAVAGFLAAWRHLVRLRKEL